MEFWAWGMVHEWFQCPMPHVGRPSRLNHPILRWSLLPTSNEKLPYPGNVLTKSSPGMTVV